MNKVANPTFFNMLNDAVNNLKDSKLADVFRFISFQPYETYHEHFHLRVEINYVKKGSCIMHIDKESIVLKENELVIICSNIDHSFESGAKGCTLMQLEFLPNVFLGFLDDNTLVGENQNPFNVFTRENRFIKLVNNVQIMNVVERIIGELKTKNLYHKHIVLIYYGELVMHIHRYLDENYMPFCSNVILQKAVGYVRLNYPNDIKVDDVANCAGVGERYLRKLFAKHLMMSPLDYINQIRVNKSIELLRITNFSIKEVCFKCGFKSPQYFSRLFKQQVGMSPYEISQNK